MTKTKAPLSREEYTEALARRLRCTMQSAARLMSDAEQDLRGACGC